MKAIKKKVKVNKIKYNSKLRFHLVCRDNAVSLP